jgi:hypothetical protein
VCFALSVAWSPAVKGGLYKGELGLVTNQASFHTRPSAASADSPTG